MKDDRARRIADALDELVAQGKRAEERYLKLLEEMAPTMKEFIAELEDQMRRSRAQRAKWAEEDAAEGAERSADAVAQMVDDAPPG